MKRHTAIPAMAFAAALVLAGCGANTTSESPGSAPSAPGTAAQTAAASAEHSRADTIFLSQMIPHLEQAVEVSEIMLGKKDIDPQIKQLAEDMKASRTQEIEQMKEWLQAWGEPGTMSTGGPSMDARDGEAGNEGERDAGQPGENDESDRRVEMSEQQFRELRSAQGIDAERLFLTGMARHHEGSIAMAEQEAKDGLNPEVMALAKKIAAEQRAEVDQMKELVASL
ncbi:DUF305 domain-containing protein [Arthrobacter mobilis]|uniref:DUF305 domain-containing protein n=1 Tax=Arthrobacter mobilis TaxID=2724944 RepID=A0A7X6HFS2_9MICC|nr:DUF305 domain-containing protein [Arthrobacter mobilis]NKX56261.1 DUF305 domain-containing protein [Arthrobacter mobilis]